MGMLTSEAGLAAMHAVLTAKHAQRAAVLGAAPQSYWRTLLAAVPQLPHMFQALRMRAPQAPSMLAASARAAPPPGTDLPRAPHQQRQGQLDVEALVLRVVGSVLGSESLDADQPLASQGMDSLAGLELRQKIQASCSSDVQSMCVSMCPCAAW